MTGPAIYYIECTKNGKRYIGSTSCDANNRMSNHRFRLRKGTHVNKSLQDDWNAFGEAAFKFIMFGTYPLESVVKEEERIGLEWGCFNPETGYNMVRPVSIHTYDNLNGYRKFTGRTKGPEKIVFKRRLAPWQVEMLEKIMPKLTAAGITMEEAEVLMANTFPALDDHEPEVVVSRPVAEAPNQVKLLLEDIQGLTDEVSGLKVELEECRNLTYDEKMAYWKARALKAEAYAASKNE